MNKRIFSILLILMITVSFFTPQLVNAEEKYDVAIDSQNEFLDAVKEAMQSFKEKISIKVNNYDDNKFDFENAINEVVMQNPEIDYNYGGASISMRSYYTYQKYRVIDIYFRYRGSEEDLDKMTDTNDYIEFKEAIVKGLNNFDDKMLIKVKDYNDEIFNLDDAIYTILSEVPDLDYGILSWSNTMYGEGKDKLLEIYMNYSYSKEKMEEMRAAVDKKAKFIIETVIKPDMNDFQKELALHDYVINNTVYNTDYEKDVILPEDEHTAYGVLIKGKGVCSSYAKAMHKLLDMVDIESYFVTGTGLGEPHAWNIVKIQNNYYHLDATWNDTVDPNKISHDYFNLTDAQMSVDHNWNTLDYPRCTSTLFSYSNIEKILSGEIEFTTPETKESNKTVKELPNNTIVIGEKAFDLDFANNTDNLSVMYNALTQEDKTNIYVKINNNWFKLDGSDATVYNLTDLSYTMDGFNYVTYKSIEDTKPYQDEKDKVVVSLENLIAGSKITIDLENRGKVDYPNADKFSLINTDEIANLGEPLFVFPSREAGDLIKVQLYTSSDEIITTLNVAIIEDIQRPTNLKAEAISDNEMQLSWDKVEGVDYYHLYESESANGPYVPYTDSEGNKEEYYWFSDYCVKIYDIAPDTTLYFKVTAVKNGEESDFSNIDSSTTFSNMDEDAISVIKDGHFYQYPQLTIEEAFDNYFNNPNWEYFKSDDDYDVVEFKGECYYNNELVEILLQFTVNVDDETFYVNYKEMDGDGMTNDNFLELLENIYK
ncbi:fibronectin type III domain-containing protein [Sporosalibacterium faouarense]|uniref:fibronectin type III domain-containing protein n=1 Tax=Sporosalibacterium faouarense TaxID=516123 RepID=UPI00192C11CF|nr:fibronectin type III domain-containing protein [Sporosalibacterium faouarense]